MGLRFVFIILALVIIYYALRTYLRRDKPSPTHKPAPTAIDMVKCDHCGTHLPKAEALVHQGQFFCSKAHLEQDSGSR